MFNKNFLHVSLSLLLLFVCGFLLPFTFWELSTPGVWDAWEIGALGASLCVGTAVLVRTRPNRQMKPLSLRTLALRKIVVIQKTLFVLGLALVCLAVVMQLRH